MAKKVENNELMGLKVGNILNSCWGYEAEIYDFYEVVGVTKTMVKLRELKKKTAGQTAYPMYYGRLVAPITEGEDRFTGEVLYRKPFNYSANNDPRNTGVAITSYAYALLWDGKPRDEYNAH